MAPSSATESETGVAPEVERFQFNLPGRLEYRDAARAFLSYVCDQLCKRGDLPTDLGHQVVSAFVEAFNNAVIHAYKNMEPGLVEVAMEVGDGRLLVTVADQGHTFTPDAVPEPDLDALPEGGLGIFIIRNFMDNVRYDRVGDRNVLTMEKSLSPKAEREGAEGQDPGADNARKTEAD